MDKMPDIEKDASAALDRELQAYLGRQLRRLFNQTAAEPIPDRFADLLERLDREAPRPEARVPRQEAL